MQAELSERSVPWLLVSLPLAWCGLWAGGVLGLLLAPLFLLAAVEAVSRGRPLFLIYSAPALAMLALHAIVANHYTRYNLILIGPFSVGAAWLLVRLGDACRTRLLPAVVQ